MITKDIKENQSFRRKELRKWVREQNKEERIKKQIHFGLALLGGFIFSIVIGILYVLWLLWMLLNY